ncbi:MAG: gamma-glutamylcyclotransferase [Geminicoccaceae bacterium]
MPEPVLTRENIRSGAVRRIAADHGLMRILSDEELASSLGRLLDGADLSRGVWVFGYGSLIWNPAFHFTDRVVGRVFGFHRRFCLWTHLGRGCPERPGLVLGLERGGSCRGVAYHIAQGAAREELDIVWRREMISDAYVPRWVDVRTPIATVRAITFTINQAHERYARDLSDEEAAAAIAGASGFLGACADYLINTVDHLAELGIHDRPLERLRARVLAQTAVPPQAD